MVEITEISKAQMLTFWLDNLLESIVVIGNDVYAKTHSEIHATYKAVVHCTVT